MTIMCSLKQCMMMHVFTKAMHDDAWRKHGTSPYGGPDCVEDVCICIRFQIPIKVWGEAGNAFEGRYGDRGHKSHKAGFGV